ncbi:MAG: GDP-mannose 4,6-dehydratase [Planctomycetes bacterium]|nr:GDP-mannose 4,6-dehydratase [Planctomycetota bacterium]
MRALITGINGFVGSHLAERLLSNGCEVAGTIQPGTTLDNLAHLGQQARTMPCDVTDAAAVRDALTATKPDLIFHLAAVTFVPTSFASPRLTWQTNLFGTLNLYDALKALGISPRILFVSSSDVYGRVRAEDLPITESAPLRPVSPYAASKAAADLASFEYAHDAGLDIVRVRPFNHTGPRQSPSFVCSDFARQVARAERFAGEAVVRVGDIENKRDFTDVRDMVHAYWLALAKGHRGEAYNLCSERAVKVADVLDTLIRLSKRKIRVEKDAQRLRPTDISTILGSSAKFRDATGWQPAIPLEKTLADLLDYWRGGLG